MKTTETVWQNRLVFSNSAAGVALRIALIYIIFGGLWILCSDQIMAIIFKDPPASPHLNGKVERSQKTDIDEFYSTVDLKSLNLDQQLEEMQFFYNWHRPHGSLKGASPIDKVCDLTDKISYWADVYDNFNSNQEGYQEKKL